MSGVYDQLGQIMHAQRTAALSVLEDVGECQHLSTHPEQVELDQLPGQQSLYSRAVEVCDNCDQLVEDE